MLFDSFEIVDQPKDQAMPIIRLARYIFAICANSASCERLFSAFGNILTKVRNRMGKETLQTLAEIKMHVRDEHLAHNEMKNRLKRRLGTVDTSLPQQYPGPPPPPPSSAHSSSITQPSQIASTSSVPYDPPSPNPDETESNTEDNIVDDQSTQLLRTIIDQFIQQGQMDDTDDAESDYLAPITGEPVAPVSLEELFDFSRVDWVPHHQRTSHRSLSDELEVYNLLDADLPGEEGVEVAIDDTTGDILTLNV